jgi:hypothetical protein
MTALLALLDRLIDVVFPPPGGSQKEIDTRFAEIVENFDAPQNP